MTLIDEAIAAAKSPTQESPPIEAPIGKRWWKRKATRNWAILVLLLALLVGLQALDPGESTKAYDPDSTKPNGTRAFVRLMEEAGAKVERTNMPSGRTAVLMRDTLSVSETRAVERWIEMGGTLIVGDPFSSFQMGSFSGGQFVMPSRLQPRCVIPFVGGVQHISPARDENYLTFESDLVGDGQCFPMGKGNDATYYLQVRSVGRGTVISLGGSHIFTNDRLDVLDNSVLLVNMLRPSENNSIAILETREGGGASVPDEDRSSVSELVPKSVVDAQWLLLTGAVAWMIWLARRLGRPVEEEPLVRIPASQLVVATGNLMELSNQPYAAAVTMRDGFRRSVSDRFGIRNDATDDVIIELVSRRTGIPEARLRAVLQPSSVVTPEALVAYAQEIEHLQQEVSYVR